MPDFETLVTAAEAADVSGWDFSWLDGRATEERPPWGYARLLADRLARATAALDIDTGGGEILAEMPQLPARMCAVENFAPNLELARARLGPRGVVVSSLVDGHLPYASGTFDLVSSRHPVRPDWPEITRVLADQGTYLGQHVGPHSARELIEFFIGPQQDQRHVRDPRIETAEAEFHGLEIVDLQQANCRMEFRDIGAVVWILRRCPWWVPDFTVDRYRDELRRLHEQIERDGVFVAHSTRHLIEGRRQPR